jgi:predicted phage terminase large subunit-like protein
VWGLIGPDMILFDQVRGKWDFPETIKQFLALTERWPQAFKKLVEDKANGPALIALLSDQVPGIVAIRPDGTKASRAHAVSSLIEAGNVVLPVSSIAPWVDAFVDECAAFPKGAHDDQVDCCTQALKALQVGWGQIQTLYCELDEDDYRVHISPY